jgi:hypothetical protein
LISFLTAGHQSPVKQTLHSVRLPQHLTDFTSKTAIALMMEAVNNPETSVNFYQTTRRNNPEDSYRYTRRRENLKPYYLFISGVFNDTDNSSEHSIK